MKPKVETLTADLLRSVLSYDPETGVFRWIALPHKSASNIRIGDIAGYAENTGYVRITIGGRRYQAHRLAWLWVYEKWPEQLDHKDGNRSNNAISNLRAATNFQNSTNKKCHVNNFLGVKCVRLHESGRYQARIYVEGRHKHLGLYDTIEEAKFAYEIAAQEAFGEYARTK